jgi:hypothetical protein
MNLTNEQLQAITKALRAIDKPNMAYGYDGPYQWRSEDIAKDAITLIEALTADNAALREQNNRAGWARVEDGLPEKHGRYLVVQRSCLGGVTYTSVASWGYPDATEDLYDACWYQWDGDGFDYRINAVTHWMPLPEPPEVQS